MTISTNDAQGVLLLARSFMPTISKNGYFEARNEAQEKRVDKFLNALRSQEFTETHDKGGNEYSFVFKKGVVQVKVSYRYGVGYSAILGIFDK